jgi:hypothetical protein
VEPDDAPALPGWVVAALQQPAVWAEPPAGLEDAVVTAVIADRAAAPPVTSTLLEPAGRRTAPPPPSRSGNRGVWRFAAVAAVVIAAAVGVVIVTADDEADRPLALPIGGTELAPEASAVAEVEELPAGVAIALDVSDLDPAPPGHYYQGWVRSEDGDLVSVGTFHMRGGDALVTLWSGVSIEDYPILSVTLQQEDAGPESSGQVVLRGSLQP